MRCVETTDEFLANTRGHRVLVGFQDHRPFDAVVQRLFTLRHVLRTIKNTNSCGYASAL